MWFCGYGNQHIYCVYGVLAAVGSTCIIWWQGHYAHDLAFFRHLLSSRQCFMLAFIQWDQQLWNPTLLIYFDHYLSHMKITPGYHWNAASLDVVFEMDKNNHWCISIPSNRCGPPLIGQYIDQMWSLRWTETIKDVLQSHPTFVAHLQSDNVLMYTSYVVVLLMHQR